MKVFTGSSVLLRLAIKRDRVIVPAWVVGISFVVVGTASSLGELYPRIADRLELASTVMSTGALRAFTGQPFDLTSLGGLTAWRTTGSAIVLAGIMSTFAVVRHSRAEEDSGRAELIMAAPVGSMASIASTVMLLVIANLAMAFVVIVGLVLMHLPFSGSVLTGFSIASSGICFGAIALFTAQFFSTGRGANACAAAAIAGSFVVRAVGDAGNTWISWLSPIAWGQRTQPFAENRWAVLLAPLTLTLVCLVATALASSRRDLGSGLSSERCGHASARPQMRSPFALAWRLQRGSFIGWSIGLAVAGMAVGSMASNVNDIIGDNRGVEKVLTRSDAGAGVVDSYLFAVITLFALVAGAAAVSNVFRLRSEESSGRAEVVLASPTSRCRYAFSFAAVTAVGNVCILLSAGLGLGITHSLHTRDAVQVPRLVLATIASLPVSLVAAALAFVIFGFAPKYMDAAWALMAGCFVLSEVGAIAGLPSWMVSVSPFSHLPDVLTGDWQRVASLVAIVAISGAVLSTHEGLKRRDMT